MTPIRVAYVIPTMVQGGAEKQLSLLVRHLPREQFEPKVFLLTHDGPLSTDIRAAGIEVELIGKSFKADPTALWRLQRALRRFRPTIVQTSLFAANSFGRVAAKMARVPIQIASERCVDHWKRPWHFVVDRYLARQTDALTTNSHGVVDFYHAHGIDADRFTVIPNAIEMSNEVHRWSRDQAAAELELDPSRRWILATGRLWHQKRYRDLIWSAELLATVREDTTLVIAGDGPQRDELLRFRDDVSTVRHIRFVGHRDDLHAWRHHAAMFWNASESEGQSNAILEAMLSGVPVVASDIPGNRDLVDDGETGRLVPLGDPAAMAAAGSELLEAPEPAATMADAARRRVQTEFTVDAMVDAHVRMYRRLMANDE